MSQGDSQRSSQPAGDSKKTRPMAKAACGVASMTGKACSQRASCCRMKPSDNKQAARQQLSAVDATPVQSVSISAEGSCASDSKASQAAGTIACRTAAMAAQAMGRPAIKISSSKASPCHAGKRRRV